MFLDLAISLLHTMVVAEWTWREFLNIVEQSSQEDVLGESLHWPYHIAMQREMHDHCRPFRLMGRCPK